MTIACPEKLYRQISQCNLCDVPLGPKPIFQAHPDARILIAGQAPGSKTHEKGIPFDDASGERLRQWLGLTRESFYNAQLVAIVPMAFCFPGTGKSGDLPPMPECASTWRSQLMHTLGQIELTIIIGRYAIDWHLPQYKGANVTQVVSQWRQHQPAKFVLPHPSPRNNRWLKQNSWFESDVIPALKQRVAEITTADGVTPHQSD